MAFLIGGANTLDDSYSISNSLRFNDGDSGYIYRTPSSASNQRTWTWSGWFKRSDITTAQNLWTAGADVNNRCHLDINASGTFQVEAKNGGSSVMKCEGGGVLRDPSAWMHLVWRMDTTQGTDSDRIRIYLNGTQFTFSSNSYPSQNTEMAINNNVLHSFGKRTWADQNYFDGYLAEVHFVDGQSYAPTVFGETNDNGVWIPKDCKDDITYGTNGYFLEFKETGTSANSSGMGADTSGNNHHFSISGLAARSVVQDTPTNNFMTFNPLYTNSRGTFAEGNLQVTTNVQGSVPYGQVEFGNFHVNSGKWYWEVEVVEVGSGGSLGLGANERAYEGTYVNGHNNGGSAGNIRYNHSNGNVNNGSSTAVSGAATYTDDDTIGFAMDLDNNKMYIHKNGTYINSGDPAAGSNGITMTSSYSDYWTPWISKDDTSNNAKVYLNTGNPVLANDSGNADDNGYGDFEYDVPAGFYSLCTKNLATYG